MIRQGAHRRTPQAWQGLRERLYRAQWDVLELGFTLTEERQLRTDADALMGHLVTRAEEAEAHAAAAKSALIVERERMRQANQLIADLRQQLAAPKPPPASHETQEMRLAVAPLGSPTWHAAHAS